MIPEKKILVPSGRTNNWSSDKMQPLPTYFLTSFDTKGLIISLFLMFINGAHGYINEVERKNTKGFKTQNFPYHLLHSRN